MHEQKIRQELLNMQDKKYKDFHSKLCPGTENIIGVRIPLLRNYAKQISKEPFWKEYVLSAKIKYNEEVMLQGMLIGLAKKIDIKEALKLIEGFVPKINNWGICDIFCGELKITVKNEDIIWNFIQKYLKSKKEFELRFAIVIILGYYLTDEYILKVFPIFDRIKHDGYYVKMAVAWAISNAFIKYPKETMQYLKKSSLDDWTYNKALQKITESFRVDKKTKEIIRSMKR
ncbi:MAG: DNA alkylation repair protein [Endomicrobiaceae bacterium]|nr:DNA alkylation repair protein [Endomicrobiaceae bacterium]MDD3923208.1 DNA alkylation repair protein [Endomicrobiaceae bacterium]